MQEYTNKQIVELEPITTLRDKQGFRFYSTDDGKILYAEKNGKIYNVSEDSLKPIGEVPLAHRRFEFVGIVNDEDVKNLYPLYYEYKTFGKVKEKVGMAEGGELEIGDYVKIKETYGGGSGTVEDIVNNFVIVKTKEGKQSYHKSDLIAYSSASEAAYDLGDEGDSDYEDDYAKGGVIRVGDNIRLKKDLPYLSSFSNLYDKDLKVNNISETYFASGTKKYYHVEYEGDKYEVMEDFVDNEKMEKGGELPTITKEEWSKKQKDSKLKTEDGKYYIMKYDDKIGTYLQQVKVLEDGGMMAHGGETHEGKILFTINDDKIDELLSSSNLNYQFMDDDGYLLSEKDFEKFKVMVSDKGYNDDNIFVSEYNYAAGGMTPGRYYIDNSGNELRYVGESQGKLLFKDGEKIITKSEKDFEDRPKETKLFGFFKKGGEVDTYEIELSAVPNPDYADEDDRGSVNIKKSRKKVSDVEEARRVVREFIEENDLGSGNWPNGSVYKNGKKIGYISYNGRFWDDTKMADGGEVNEDEIVEKLEEQFKGKDLWEDEILDEYEVKMFDWEEYDDGESYDKWKRSKEKKNYIVPFESNDDSYIFILVPKNKMEEGGEVTKSGQLKSKIEKILDKVLPGFYKEVFVRKNYIGKGEYIGIIMAASNYEINRVKGQYPQDVSLMLDVEEMDLHVQVFGGNGGNRIYLQPDMNDPKEKYLAMASVKIPFRTPKKEEKFVLQAIEKFAENYENALKENKDRLMYKEYVNYDTLIMADGGETELVQDSKTKEFTRRMKTKPEDVETIKKIQYMMAKEKLKSLSKNKMADGGEATFMDKVKAVEKNLLKKKKVPAIVQKDYGKTYDKKEARESAMRIIGSQTAKWKSKNSMQKGGKTSVSPLKDKIFGSKKNKTGSARSKTSAKEIELNETIIQALSDKAKEYNEKHSSKVSTSTLKAVMRRGMGAFSSSHRPGMTRQGWGYARVNKFLLKKGGKKVKAGYTQDDDLL